jgi:uncharacterized membrane protein YphA (DoxX/SURF4 family)
MTLVRAIGRTMLSSYFVLSGIRAIRNPDEFVADAQPVADRLVPAIKRYAPNEVADFVPENTATLVRVNGAFQLAGGLAMATGKGRRLGAGLLALSMIPTTLARHPFWTRDDPEQKAHDRQQFVKNVGLLGGVIIASRDTEGRPGLVWRANEGRELAVKRTRKARKAAKKALKHTRSDAATAAIGSGLALVGDVVEDVVSESRKVRRQATKRAGRTAKQARKQARKAGQQARKNVSHSLDNVGKSASKVQKRAIEAAEDASKNVRKAAGGVRSSLGEHIELGQN